MRSLLDINVRARLFLHILQLIPKIRMPSESEFLKFLSYNSSMFFLFPTLGIFHLQNICLGSKALLFFILMRRMLDMTGILFLKYYGSCSGHLIHGGV